MKDVFLYGGHGYLGQNIQEYFKDNPGYNVVATYKEAMDTFSTLNQRFFIHLACPRKTIDATLIKTHKRPVEQLNNNVSWWMVRLCEALYTGKQYIRNLSIPSGNVLYFSSQSIWDRPNSLYGLFKEMGALEYDNYSVVTPGTVFGHLPNSLLRIDTVINKVVQRLSTDQKAFVTHTKRCWTPIEDVCTGIEDFMNRRYNSFKNKLDCVRQGKVMLDTLFKDELQKNPDLRLIYETGCSLDNSIIGCPMTRVVCLQEQIKRFLVAEKSATLRSSI